MNAVPLTVMSDDQLWQRSRDGDREAFGQIVERYQSLICSLAYSACGNLRAVRGSRPGDVHRRVANSWENCMNPPSYAPGSAESCGICQPTHCVGEQRRGGFAKSLNSVAELAGSDADPAVQAATQEKAALVGARLRDYRRHIANQWCCFTGKDSPSQRSRGRSTSPRKR